MMQATLSPSKEKGEVKYVNNQSTKQRNKQLPLPLSSSAEVSQALRKQLSWGAVLDIQSIPKLL